jgi:hypothetical protein
MNNNNTKYSLPSSNRVQKRWNLGLLVLEKVFLRVAAPPIQGPTLFFVAVSILLLFMGSLSFIIKFHSSLAGS